MALEFSQGFDKILRCALLLSLGLIDQATTFAEGHGGGGAGSNMPWEEKDDEDDRKWLMRCLRQATHMMQPRGKQKKR